MDWRMKAVTRWALPPSVVVGRIQRHEVELACGKFMRADETFVSRRLRPVGWAGCLHARCC